MLFPMVPSFLLCVKRPLNKVSGNESGKNNKNNQMATVASNRRIPPLIALPQNRIVPNQIKRWQEKFEKKTFKRKGGCLSWDSHSLKENRRKRK